jgi:hypothetical protein
MYGDRSLLEQFGFLDPIEDIDVCGTPKALATQITAHSIPDSDKPMSQVIAELEAAYAHATPVVCDFLGPYNCTDECDAVPGDLDGDCDVDLDDFAAFKTCFTGPDGGPIDPNCAAGDFDGDDDIDCVDWAEFKANWTGPPANPPRLLRCDMPQFDTPPGDAEPAGPLAPIDKQPMP